MAWACFFSMVVAQFIKPFLAIRTGQRFEFVRMFHNGGMPSSHTSLVTTLTLFVAEAEGSSSVLFAIALVFSLYFVFEATGLRQEVGQQAKLLNEMLDELRKTHHVDQRRLRELVGHTWQEVLGGAVTGTAVYWLLRGWVFGR
jgi:acid phosphatase family membrane protein YuiD